MDLGLAGAKVLVIASRSGLGAATARRFSLEGALVAVNGRDPDTIKETAAAIQVESGNPVYAVAGDVTQREVAIQVVEQAAQQLGGLDILVTNSGGPRSGGFAALSMEEWDKGFQLILGSVIQMIQTALPYLQQSKQPAILTISSLSAKQPIPNLLISNVMRAGISGLVKSLANEWGPQGIRVNAILPGWTATARVGEIMEARAATNKTSVEEEAVKRQVAIPLRRMGTPEEFGNVAAFLCSPAGGFIHGAMIIVDGGEIQATM